MGSNSGNFVEVSLTLQNVGRHPVYSGVNSTAQFLADFARNEYSWAEILTPGFQIHSRMDLLIDAMAQDTEFNTPEKLAIAAYNDFYLSNYNMLGATGPGVTLSGTVQALCQVYNWSCSDSSIHGMPSMNHFNSDQATCGYGCSGNPYDAWWPFAPLGWGDSHEMGHNLQSFGLSDKTGSVVTGEVSNNIFPLHVVIEYGYKHPDLIHIHSHEMEQDAMYFELNHAQNQPDPKAYITDKIWGSAANTVGNNGMWRLSTYQQFVLMANAQGGRFGDGGWDIITMMYMSYRLKSWAQSDDNRWYLWKSKLGYSNYTRSESQNIHANDQMLITTSYLLRLNLCPFYDMYGLYYSQKAAIQVYNYGYPLVRKQFYYFPYDFNSQPVMSMAAAGVIPVDGVNRTVPHTSIAYIVTEQNARTFTRGVPKMLRAWVSGPGTVSFV